MKCFQFYNGAKNEEPKTTRPNSALSSFADHEIRQSGSEFNSQNASDTSSESRGRSQFPNMSQRSTSLRDFTFSELKQATKNFSRTAKLGEGGFGCVFKGVIRSSEEPYKKIDVAVKQLGRRGLQVMHNLIANGSVEDHLSMIRRHLSYAIAIQGLRSNNHPLEGHKEWVTEVNVLGVVEHPNLVKLIGYCAEDDERGIQRLLIYEYMPNGSVEDHLSLKSVTPLSWAMRLKIALDAARGLAYLHEEMDFQIIFRDFKSSNILLDEQWNAKLSDFGLARLGPAEGLTHISTAVVGTMGYAAPEYIQTGRLTSKSDVWSYGVFLYELITGRRPLDRNRPRNEQKLLEWVKPYLSDAKKFRLILDPRLEWKQILKSAHKLSRVANRCLARLPKARPTMSEVREMVTQVVEASAGGANHPQPPLKGKKGKKNFEQKSEGKCRGLVDTKIGDCEWLIRTWSSKLVKTC